MNSQHENVYTEPRQFQSLPNEVVEELDGNHLEKRSRDAIRLSTVGEDGWPHAAQLSVRQYLGQLIETNHPVDPDCELAWVYKRVGAGGTVDPTPTGIIIRIIIGYPVIA